jgi:hypothetical protein
MRMSAKERVRELIDGLTEAECQRLTEGVDVYGEQAFDLDIYALVDAVKRELNPPIPGELTIAEFADWGAILRRTETPLMTAMRTGEPSRGWGWGSPETTEGPIDGDDER